MAEEVNILTTSDGDTPLIPAATAIETFRNSGYKSTAAALAELIDNSIEAGAENIQVLTFENPIQGRQRTLYKIVKVAVYDDGEGMDVDTLQMALQFGVGTRMKTRKGMGRFGIGLPNASISQCQRVEIYSWQNGECYTTYLDVDEIKKHKSQNANPVTKCKVPVDILKHAENGYDKDSGTLVVWDKCDRLDIDRSKTLYKNMEKDLCRIYRHFLDNDNSYGNKVSVRLVTTGKQRVIYTLKANDPMYLLTPNNIPGFENAATNTSHGIVKLDIPYNEDGDTAVVEMRFSIALPKIQSNEGGGGGIGQKHYAYNAGISFVRACREIDFGDFGYFNPRAEMERWWGCEIRFEPELDELFGVANNKQSVRGARFFDEKEFEREHGEHWEDDLKEDLRLNFRYKLSKAFSSNRETMMKVINSRGKGLNSESGKPSSKASKVVNEVLEDSKEATKSQIVSSGKSQEDKAQEWLDKLKVDEPNLTPEELKEVADERSHSRLEIDFGHWPGEQFFSIETYGETPVITINKKHPFYTELYEPLSNDDPKLTDAIDLLMMAYARTEEELYSYSDELEKIRSRWGGHLQDFLKALKKFA